MGTVVLLVDLVGGAGADWDLGGDAGADLDVLEDRVIEEDLGFAFVFLPSSVVSLPLFDNIRKNVSTASASLAFKTSSRSDSMKDRWL